MMKKLIKSISFVLVFVILTGMFTTVSASVKASSDEALQVLQKLNIILTKDKADDFSEDKAVTKGDFSIYLVRALKMSSYSDVSLPFSDITDNDAIAPYIKTLYEAGVINGYNNEFNVNKNISYNEAVKMMVSAIGYENMAQMNGGYPTGYLKVANDLKITENVAFQNNETITKKDAASLIFNMLNAELFEMKEISHEGVSYEKSEETMFSKLYDIHNARGRVLKNSNVSLLSDNKPADIGFVQIDDKIYKEGDIDVKSFIGYEIEFYYQYNEETEESEIILVTELDDDKKEIYIKAEDIQDFSDNRYKYTDENGKIKTLILSDEYYLSYNMAYPLSGFTEDKMKPLYGGVKIIWGGKSGKPDVVMIDEFTSYAVSSVDVIGEIIYSKNKDSENFSQVDYKVINSDGRDVDLSALDENSVVSEAWSSDNSRVVLYVSDDYVTGTISSTKNENETTYITINDNKYAVNDDCYNKNSIELNAGVTAYLDILGRVVSVDIEKNEGMKYAYLVKAFINEDDDYGYVRLFDTNGNFNTYQLHEKVKINDVRYTSEEIAVNYLRNLSTNIVKFELNSKNLVSNMIVSDGTNKYIHQVSVIQNIWNSNNRTLGGRASFEGPSPVFVIPGEDESKYKVESTSSFGHDSAISGTVEAYTTGDNIYAEVILRSDGAAAALQRNCAVVKSVVETINEYDEPTRKITVLYDGTTAEYELTPDMTVALGVGDILQIGMDFEGKIANIVRLYDAENDTMTVSNPYEPQAGTGYRSARRAYLGYVYFKDKGLMKFGPDIPTNENLNTAYVENALLSGFNIYVVDMDAPKANRVYIGSENDITDFYHSGAAYSKVMVLTMWNDPEDIVIIK